MQLNTSLTKLTLRIAFLTKLYLEVRQNVSWLFPSLVTT